MSEFSAIRSRIRRDPRWFFVNVLGAEPWDAQIQIAESLRDNPTTSVASCHGIGKTWTSARLVVWFMMAFCPDCICITTAPTDRQVRGILWKELRTAVKGCQFNIGRSPLLQEWKLADDWFAIGFTAPDYDSTKVQGWHARYVLVVVDEAAGVSQEVEDGLAGVLTNPRNCRLLRIGNPTDPLSVFGKEHGTTGVSSLNISAFDTPNFTDFGVKIEHLRNGEWEQMVEDVEYRYPNLVTPEWVAARMRKWGESNPLFVSRVMGQFPKDAANAVIPLSFIEAAQRRTLERGAVCRLSVDVAGEGQDRNVISGAWGPVFRVLEEDNAWRPATLVGHVKQHVRDHNAEEVRIDPIGVGYGPTEDLKDWNYSVRITPINVGENALDSDNYANRRSECWWHLRERFESGDMDIDPMDDELAGELASITWGPDKRERIAVTPKKAMKKAGFNSPDRADTLMMAYAPTEPVAGPNIFV